MSTRLQRAQFLFNQQHFPAARDELTQALTEDPNHAMCHALLALCQCALKENILARHHAETAAALAPEHPDALFVLSRVLVPFFDWQPIRVQTPYGICITQKAVCSLTFTKSLHAIQEAIRFEPENPEFYAHLSCLKLMTMDWHEAMAIATRGLQHSPQHAGCLVNRATALIEIGSRDQAETIVRDLLAIDPESPEAHAGMGDLFLSRRQAKEAERHYRDALRLDPLLPWAQYGLKAAQALETRHAFVREMLVHRDTWGDPWRTFNQVRVLLLILVCLFAIGFAVIGHIYSKALTVRAREKVIRANPLAATNEPPRRTMDRSPTDNRK
jgi:tetratricopeptide (TPR) repeat protein